MKHNENKPTEKIHLAFWLTGYRFPENWMNPKQKSSIFEILKLLFKNYLKNYISPTKFYLLKIHNYFEQGLTFVHKSKNLAYLGISQKFNFKILRPIKQEVFFGWIEWENVLPYVLKSSQPLFSCF
ncbi:MAG: hypothetical protein KatS3mg035_1530 [Bacteroidia bacterium]|nr:MAG: hypothetical protein KatS3mg035_1530 [Bacteroidia bacterium]